MTSTPDQTSSDWFRGFSKPLLLESVVVVVSEIAIVEHPKRGFEAAVIFDARTTELRPPDVPPIIHFESIEQFKKFLERDNTIFSSMLKVSCNFTRDELQVLLDIEKTARTFVLLNSCSHIMTIHEPPQ